MKKALILIMVLIMLLGLVGCGKSDEAKKAEELISSIGEVTPESGAKISEAQSYYDSLSKEQKAEVDNLSVLVDAQNTFNSFEVELTPENIREYLNFSFEKINHETSSILGHSSWTTEKQMTIYPIQSGNFNNVEITLKFIIYNHIAVHEPSNVVVEEIDDLDDYVYYTFKLPAYGDFDEIFRYGGLLFEQDNAFENFQVESVTGTFKAAN